MRVKERSQVNLLLLSEDVRLAEAFERVGGFHKCHVINEPAFAADPQEELLSSCAAVAVSERTLGIEAALAVRERCPDALFFYLICNSPNAQELNRLRGLCAAHEVVPILPYRTVEQICLEVARLCRGEAAPQSRVIAAVGAVPQLGLTTSLLHTALKLSERTGIHIGVLGMNGWNPGDTGIAYEGKYLDELWGLLQGKRLGGEELLSKMHPLGPRVRYLAGSRDLKRLYYYSPDGVAWLIARAQECFDLVLIDAGSYPDHALAAQSLLMSDLQLVQADQSLQAREQWRRIREQILEPVLGFEPGKALLVLNRMKPEAGLENERQLAQQIGLPSLCRLPECPELFVAEAERKLLKPPPHEYAAEIDKLVRALIRYYSFPEPRSPGVPAKDTQTGGRPWWRRFGSGEAKGALSK